MKEKELPLVSVCIPAYNHEKYVGECIQSVIDQDYENIELIIINDGSRDNTHDVIMSFEKVCRERFVRFEYRNRENRGLSATLNESIDWSKGKYYTGIASDDIMFKNKVSLLLDKLESLDESYAVAFGNAIFIDNSGNELYLDVKTGMPTDKDKGVNLFLDYYTYMRDFDYKDKNLFGSYKTLLIGNYLPAMSYLIKLDKIREVGAWTYGNTIEDWEMWLKLSKNYKFAYIDQPVALYRLHGGNSIKTISKKIHYDSISILEREKKYSFERGLVNIYYDSLVSLVLGMRHYDVLDFFYEVFKNSFNIYFLKLLIKKVLRRVFK